MGGILPLSGVCWGRGGSGELGVALLAGRSLRCSREEEKREVWGEEGNPGRGRPAGWREGAGGGSQAPQRKVKNLFLASFYHYHHRCHHIKGFFVRAN